MRLKRVKSKKKPTPKKTVRKKAAQVVSAAEGVSKESIRLVGLHNLKAPLGAHKTKKLLGRGAGSGHGGTSTRGNKGQRARAGRDFYLGFEGGQVPLIRKIPKRGFTSKFKKEYQIVNLKDLKKIKDEIINPELLAARGLIKDKTKLVKILGEGEIEKPVVIQVHAASRKAVEKLKNAGGGVQILKCLAH